MTSDSTAETRGESQSETSEESSFASVGTPTEPGQQDISMLNQNDSHLPGSIANATDDTSSTLTLSRSHRLERPWRLPGLDELPVITMEHNFHLSGFITEATDDISDPPTL